MENIKVFNELWNLYSSFLATNKAQLSNEKLEDMAFECRDKFVRDSSKITKTPFSNEELLEAYNIVDLFLKANKSIL